MQSRCAVLVLRLAAGACAATLVLSASSPSFAQQEHGEVTADAGMGPGPGPAADPTPPTPAPPVVTPPLPPPTPPMAPQTPPASPPAEAPPAVAVATDAKPTFSVVPMGYVEAHYAYNFNRPSNGITNFRGFDNRHNTFTLANAAFGGDVTAGPVGGRLILQLGSTPSTYYLAEPALPGAAGANATGPGLWQYLQEAFVTYKAPVGRGVLFQLGLFSSPIGREVFAVKDNWNWSRSNLFFGLPFYHTGLQASYELTDELTATASVVNGWNSVVDNNEEKSVYGSLVYRKKDVLSLKAVYFGGIERTTGSAEGPYWRHHFNGTAEYHATPWLSLAGQADYGFENNRIGSARWIAGALYTRVRPAKNVYLALRGDRFHEHLATGGAASSAPIFWSGVEWVSSGTATLEVTPHEHISVRLEFRHDVAASPLFFGRNVQTDSSTNQFLANARTQDTVLLGATAWF